MEGGEAQLRTLREGNSSPARQVSWLHLQLKNAMALNHNANVRLNAANSKVAELERLITAEKAAYKQKEKEMAELQVRFPIKLVINMARFA